MKRLLLFSLLFSSIALGASSPDQITVLKNSMMKELLEHAEITEVRATGSMKPTFDENYWLIVQMIPWKDLKPGDIIIYRRKEPMVFEGEKCYRVCHRIVARSTPKGEFLTTKGDNNRWPDSIYVTEDMYEGTVVAWIRKDVVVKCVAL